MPNYVNMADIIGKLGIDMAQHTAEYTNPIDAVLTQDEDIDFSIIELLFFAYRDFTSDPDMLLADYGFGRAHHRILHFINRRPGMTVAKLLDVLQITKQSLARVLKQLIDTGHVIQVQGSRDRRQRELYPTAKGHALALELARPQSRRVRAALDGVSSRERETIERFLKAMVNSELRRQIDNRPQSNSSNSVSTFAHGGKTTG